MPVAKLKNVTLSYHEYGDKHLPTVVLIMGLGMSEHSWPKELLRLLVKKGLRVITFDNRDVGHSQYFPTDKNFQSVPIAIGRALLRLPVKAPYKLENMALDLVELLDYLKIDSAHLVGVSMGGMIAQVTATIRPSRVKSLTSIMSASGNPRTGTGKVKAIYSLFMHPEQPDNPEKLFEHFCRVFNTLKSPKYEYPREEQEKLLRDSSQIPFDSKGAERQLLAILASGDRSAQLSRLSTPTLVIHGEDDPLLPLSAGKEVADLIPNAKLKVMPLMGHDLPPIHYEEISSAIAKHIWDAEN